MLPISTVIRKLRRERNITQEEVAQALGVTYQSVSRWENGLAYPDIELIPKIAQLFHISTDMLFGTDLESMEEKIATHTRLIREVQDNPEQFYLTCRAAYEEFPKEYSFGIWLCRCYLEHGVRPHEKHLKEIRAICRNILENCPDEDYRLEAMRYIMIAESEDSLDTWSHLIPGWKACREVLLEARYEYRNDAEKHRMQMQENLLSFMRYVFYNCIGQESSTETVEGYKLVLKLIDDMRDPSTDTDAWMCMRADFYMRIAGVYFKQEKCDEGYFALEKAIDLYAQYGQLPVETVLSYNCPVLNLLTDNKLSEPEDDTNDKGEYVCWWAYQGLTDVNGSFALIQEDSRFTELVVRLVPYLPKAKNEN